MAPPRARDAAPPQEEAFEPRETAEVAFEAVNRDRILDETATEREALGY